MSRRAAPRRAPGTGGRGAAPSPTRVLFFGAGASKAFGHPITSEILPRVRERLVSRDLFPVTSNPARERAKMRRLSDYITRLMPTFFEQQSLPMITDVLSLVDFLLTTGEVAIPMFSSNQMEDLRVLLEQAIIEAIETGNEARHPELLDKVTDWILSAPGARDEPMTIVSTNYDMLIEKRLFDKIELGDGPDLVDAVDLGFTWREHRTGRFLPETHQSPVSPVVRVFKLHGSLNWLKCPLCGFIYVNTTGSINSQAFRADKIDYNNTCLCGHGPVRSVIVAPSMVRLVQDPNLLTVWRSALERLRTADEWVVVGYSLPPEDIAIRSILLRGFHGRGKSKPPRITVVQDGPNAETENRYRTLFPNCTFECDGFEGYIGALPEPRRHFPTF